jgi:hypothetical protein
VAVDKLYQTSTGTKFEQHVPPRVKPSDDDVVNMALLEGALAAARAERERNS